MDGRASARLPARAATGDGGDGAGRASARWRAWLSGRGLPWRGVSAAGGLDATYGSLSSPTIPLPAAAARAAGDFTRSGHPDGASVARRSRRWRIAPGAGRVTLALGILALGAALAIALTMSDARRRENEAGGGDAGAERQSVNDR